MPLGQHIQEIVQALDGAVPAPPQAVHISIPGAFLDIHGIVGTEGGADPARQAALGKPLMVFQGIRRVVGGAHGLHIHGENQGLGGELRRLQLPAGLLPDGQGILLVDLLGNA